MAAPQQPETAENPRQPPSREPLPVELEALPWLRIVGTIENLHFHLIGKPAVQGTYSLAEGWVDRGFESLAAAAKKVGLAP